MKSSNNSESASELERAFGDSINKAIIHCGPRDVANSASKYRGGVPLDKLYCNAYDPRSGKLAIMTFTTFLELADSISSASSKLSAQPYGLTLEDKTLIDACLTEIADQDLERLPVEDGNQWDEGSLMVARVTNDDDDNSPREN